MSTHRLTQAAVLTGVALALSLMELQLPPLAPIPGVKLGLANIVTVCAMFWLGPADTALILACRILLTALFSGNVAALLYSLAGGLLCYTVMLGLRRLVNQRQIWVCSVFGAVAHNLGQLCVAVLLTGTPALFAYLPVLLISGIIAGAVIGLLAQAVVNRLRRSGLQ